MRAGGFRAFEGNRVVPATAKEERMVLVGKVLGPLLDFGFEFKDFLEKRVYAIPYGQSYSLVASIDHFRTIGSRSGVVTEGNS